MLGAGRQQQSTLKLPQQSDGNDFPERAVPFAKGIKKNNPYTSAKQRVNAVILFIPITYTNDASRQVAFELSARYLLFVMQMIKQA